ncbi:MAG: LysR family transcriptional regulator [Cocleimonas sp.]
MDISHLKTFLEIYQTRHFRKSAEKLFITQSAASARIKLLEENLGVKLFTREKRKIEPTSAAHRFYKYADVVVSNWDQAKQMVALPDDVEQSISLACMADVWHLFLNNWISDIQRQSPELAFNLTINQANNITENVINGTLDLGLVFEPMNLPNLQMQEVLTFDIKLFSTKPQQKVEDALNEDYVMVDWGPSFAYEYSQKYAERALATIQTNYGVMALDILKNKGGAAYLPDLKALREDESITLHEVENAFVFERKLYAIFRKNTPLTNKIETLIRVVNKNISN